MAEPVTVLRRLHNLRVWPGLKRERWAVDRIDHCLTRLAEPEFGEHIATDHRTVAQIADTIARSVGLPITPNTDGPVLALLRRYATTLCHVRLG